MKAITTFSTEHHSADGGGDPLTAVRTSAKERWWKKLDTVAGASQEKADHRGHVE